MTTRIKKSLFGLFTASAMATSLFTSAFALDATQPNEDVLDQYLIESGYSQRFIDAIDETIKLRLYEGQYVHQSTGTTYGVFTEEYQVAYTLNDNGTIAIDDENLNEFERLLEDRPIVERIIDFNESKANLITSLEGFDLDVKTVQAMPIETALRTLSNWTADCVVSHKSYSGGVAKKELTYTWQWEYSPVWTLTDKMAVAWSGDFTADEDSIYWTYKKNVGYTGTGVSGNAYTDSGYGYDDYEPNAGCAVGFDIKGTYVGTYDIYHAGSLSVSLTKVTNEKTAESAIGRYYHVKILPNLSLGFSKSGPSISVTSGTSYDQSPDSAASFWSTTSGKP